MFEINSFSDLEEVKFDDLNMEQLDFTSCAINFEFGESLYQCMVRKSESSFLNQKDELRYKLNKNLNLDLNALWTSCDELYAGPSVSLEIYDYYVAEIKINLEKFNDEEISQIVFKFMEMAVEKYKALFTAEGLRSLFNIDECIERGDAGSYYDLFRYYRFVLNDKREAFHWAKKAAYSGIPRYVQNLANCYDDGIGVEKDKRLANKNLEASRRSRMGKRRRNNKNSSF